MRNFAAVHKFRRFRERCGCEPGSEGLKSAADEPTRTPGTFPMRAISRDAPAAGTCRLDRRSPRIERTDADVISVRISERKLPGSSVGVHMWLLFQPTHEPGRPWQ